MTYDEQNWNEANDYAEDDGRYDDIHMHHFAPVTGPDGGLADIADCDCGMTWDEYEYQAGAVLFDDRANEAGV